MRAELDSRLRYHRTTFCGPKGLMSKVFCLNCGADGGAVTEEWAEFVIYICEGCAKTHGSPPLPEIPEELIRR